MELLEFLAVFLWALHVVDWFEITEDIIVRTLALFETLEELRNTNSALLTTKQNEIMKLFTILAFITFPLTLFTSMFGMNTIATPIVGGTNDFWMILGIMGVVSIGFFAYFKYKRLDLVCLQQTKSRAQAAYVNIKARNTRLRV